MHMLLDIWYLSDEDEFDYKTNADTIKVLMGLNGEFWNTRNFGFWCLILKYRCWDNPIGGSQFFDGNEDRVLTWNKKKNASLVGWKLARDDKRKAYILWSWGVQTKGSSGVLEFYLMVSKRKQTKSNSGWSSKIMWKRGTINWNS